MNLIQYVASYGDLLPPAEPETKHSSTAQKSKVSSVTQLKHNCQTLPYAQVYSECIFGQMEASSRPPSQTSLLAETEQQMLQDLMSDAMEETDGQPVPGPQENGKYFAQ